MLQSPPTTMTARTASPSRPRPGARQKNSAKNPSAGAASTVSQHPKQNRTKGNSNHHQHHPNTAASQTTQAQSQPTVQPQSILSQKLKESTMPTLPHSNSEPSIPKSVSIVTPPTTPSTAKFNHKHYASDTGNQSGGGNISGGDRPKHKKKNNKRPKDHSTLFNTTPGKPAYAGPTFHHSPAPSALPLPSFFSKSMPATPSGPSLAQMMSDESSDSSLTPPTSVTKESAFESPLAKLFRADSEERARKAQGQPAAASGRPARSNAKEQTGLRSPFNDQFAPPSGLDMFFQMDVVDNRRPNTTYPNEVRPRQRADSGSQDEVAQTEAAKKRRIKALALKAALTAQPIPAQQWQGPPSPTPQPRMQSPQAERFPQSPMSPRFNPNQTKQRPGSGQYRNHINHNGNGAQNYNVNPQAYNGGGGNNYIADGSRAYITQQYNNGGVQDQNIRAPPMNPYPYSYDQNQQVPAAPRPSATIDRKEAVGQDPKAIEDYLRSVLKIGTPVLQG